jgi:poly(3-hydroxybutyrate) depolymerase
MKRFLLISIHFSLLLLFALQASAYKQESIEITVNGQKRNMVVFTPDQLPAKSPLFIITHGLNQSPEYQYDSDKMYLLIDTEKFVVAYPRAINASWDIGGTSDQTFIIKTIDEMANRFDIDRDRVYWSGFSMGSMLIHHCIANMQNKIAAFAPTSGIQFSEEPWKNCKKPVNMLECIAYGDDVFGYEKYGIHAYIENYALHDNHTQYSKTVGYKPISSSWYDGDLEKWTGGPNGGEVWLYSYNNGGHWPMDLNRHLIWNFCKRFTLNQPKAKIIMPEGETTYLFMGPKSEATYPDITIEATATATSGDIEKVEFYDGTTLIETLTAAPYTATLTAPKTGQHELRVVVTDSNGKKGENSCMVNCVASQTSYNLIQTFTTEGTVPQNWYVCNGKLKRVGGGLPYTSGCRLLHFTNETKAFEYGLMVQNPGGNEKAAWARFGDNAARSHMTLHTGHYALRSRVCNWDQPNLSPVIYTIEDLNGNEVASKTFTPAKNIGGNTANRFTSGKGQTFEFYIPETGDYVFTIYTDAVKDADFVLGMATLDVNDFSETGIQELDMMNNDDMPSKEGCFDLSGRKITERMLSNGQLKPGIYIIDGRKIVIQ